MEDKKNMSKHKLLISIISLSFALCVGLCSFLPVLNVKANTHDLSDYDLSFNLGSLVVIDETQFINPDAPPSVEHLLLSSYGSINLLYSKKNNNFRLYFPCVLDHSNTDFVSYSYFDFVSGRNYTSGFNFYVAFFNNFNLSSTIPTPIKSINLTRHNNFAFPTGFIYTDCLIENYCYIGSDGYLANRISLLDSYDNHIYFQIFIKFDIMPSLSEYSRLYYTPILYHNLKSISDKGYENGYENGYDDGYLVGEEKGLENGYDNGYSDGYLVGEEQGLETGYENGYDDGLLDGSGMPLRVFDSIKTGVSTLLNIKVLPNFTLGSALMIALGVSFFGFLLHLLIK